MTGVLEQQNRLCNALLASLNTNECMVVKIGEGDTYWENTWKTEGSGLSRGNVYTVGVEEFEDIVDCGMFPAGTILARVVVKGKKAKSRHLVLHTVKKHGDKPVSFLGDEVPLEDGFGQIDVGFLLNLLRRRLDRNPTAV